MQSIEELLSRRQQSELVTAIKGRGEIPLKFQYLGEGAKHWDEIARARGGGTRGGINTLEADLLREKGRYFVSMLKSKKINLIDMGCGNGDPIYPIIQELTKLGATLRYAPIDISPTMLKLAEERLKTRVGGLDIQPIHMDFELGSFPDKIYDLSENGYSNLLLFLGSTLGNMSDVSRFLTNVRDSMTADDFFIIGMQFVNYSKIELMMTHYTEEEVGKLISYMPQLIGIENKERHWEPMWNERKGQVEFKIRLLKEVMVKIGKDKFSLEKGEVLSLGRSLKFTESNFITTLQEAGFRTEMFTTNPEQSYAMIMVQPTRYAKG